MSASEDSKRARRPTVTAGGPPVARPELPVDAVLPDVLRELTRRGRLVFTAEPGAGKTTRLPPFLASHRGDAGQVLVLEPRRLAARLSAERVAAEGGFELGREVGFVTKIERRVSAESKLVFLTEGILARRLVKDRTLRGVGTVILDEFHERHVSTDLALALLLRLQRTERPDLHIVVMSATVDAASLAALIDAPHLHCPGRAFPVTLDYLADPEGRPLESLVASGLFETAKLPGRRDILVFLPGMREIRRAMSHCERLAAQHDLAFFALAGSLPPRDQNLALAPAPRRKVIFSTNVAETSLTIPGVGHVLDSGLANVASHSVFSGLPTLRTEKIAQAAATQRAGRAGRTEAGSALRLYSRADLERRPAFETPELLRADLADTMLLLAAAGVTDPRELVLLDPPERAAVDAARALLERLGAIDASGALCDLGRRMSELPYHPRLARAILEGGRLGALREVTAIADVLSDRGVDAPRDAGRLSSVTSDLVELVPPHLQPADDRDVRFAFLAGFPDRVGRLKQNPTTRQREIVFAEGGNALVSDQSRVREVDLCIAVAAREQIAGGQKRTVVDALSAVEPDWLLELDLERVVEESSLEIGDGIGRVVEVQSLRWGKLALTSSRRVVEDATRCGPVLAQALWERGLSLEAKDALATLEVRLALAKQHGLLTGVDAPDARALLTRAASTVTSMEELQALDLGRLAEEALPREARSALARHLPERLELPSGRSAPISYRPGQAPAVASRLQDFFGMTRGPSLASGRVPLVLELLAPNQRAVQITSDLEGFWKNHYPTLAKELRRRYPKHAWPDDPRTATPPPAVRRR
jgi:ATP-dependent helicase HrpB